MSVLGQIPDATKVVEEASRYSWEAGVLAFIIVAVVVGGGIGIWKLAWYFVHMVLGDESKGSRGLAGDWVATERSWREANTDTLKKVSERLDKQTEVCASHVTTVQAMGDSLAAQIAAAQAAQEAARLAQEAARLAAEQMTEGNKSLAKIDNTLQSRTDLLRHTATDVAQLKACAFHLCDMCQAFVAKEFPNSAGDVAAYMMAAKKKINDENAV